ncbi:MAG: hypothetical protein K6T88_13625 [Bacillus sp. (in: Bacteria)]|nr:hypothetical protein [Bacillus sp. (in: firmicutes)]
MKGMVFMEEMIDKQQYDPTIAIDDSMTGLTSANHCFGRNFVNVFLQIYRSIEISVNFFANT